MDTNPYQPPEIQSEAPRSTNKPRPGGCWVVAAFVAGTAGAWLVTGAILVQAIEGAELHPDGQFLGATCLFCPLVGLLAALVAWRVTRRPNIG